MILYDPFFPDTCIHVVYRTYAMLKSRMTSLMSASCVYACTPVIIGA